MLYQLGQSLAADLDAHLVGPPTGGALTVAEIDKLDLLTAPTWTSTKVQRIGDLSVLGAAGVTRLLAIGDDKTFKEGAAAAAVALRLGATTTEGYEIKVIDQTVDMLTTPAASWDLTEDVPAGAVILSVQANLQDEITAATAVKVGIGVAADPDKYGKTTALTVNLKVDTIPTHAVLAALEDIQIYAVDINGAAAGTIGGGAVGTDEVRVRIVYAVCNSLDDAA